MAKALRCCAETNHLARFSGALLSITRPFVLSMSKDEQRGFDQAAVAMVFMPKKCIRSINSFWIALCCGCLLGCTVANDPAETGLKAWWVKDLAMFSNPRVTVTDEDEKPLGRFSTRVLRQLSRTKVSISGASGLYSELVIVEGAEPDAFAGFFQSAVGGIPAGTPVIVMSVGLVELLGRDGDAAAYLIGHETAHLLKGHVEAKRKRSVVLRRIRVLTEARSNNTARPVTDAIPVQVSRVVTPYTEAQEQDAHSAGLRYATESGYEAGGARRLERMLQDASGTAVGPFLERHPQDLSGPSIR